MRIDQALSILRRTGFVILVIASSLAKAQAGPSPERDLAQARVDPAVHILECLIGVSATRVSTQIPDPPARAAAAKSIHKNELLRAHSERLAVLRSARGCAGTARRATGSRRQVRCRTSRGKARRARPAARLGARRAARRRRRVRLAVQAPRAIAPGQHVVAKRSLRRRGDNPMWCGAPAARPRRSRLQPRCQPLCRRNDGSTPTRRCGTAPGVVSLPPAVLPCVQPVDLIKELQ